MRLLFVVSLILGTLPAMAQTTDKPTAREIEICLQTIRDLTGGNPPKSAVALCQQGKLDAAIEKAMSGG